jgi:hypothetical protein
VTPADLETLNGTLAIGYTGWWYRQDQGQTIPGAYLWDPTVQPYVGGEFFCYHNVWAGSGTPAGLILGYNNYAFDYATPSNNVANQKNLAQGPSVVGFEISAIYSGPESDLPSGGAGFPPSWVPTFINTSPLPYFNW